MRLWHKASVATCLALLELPRICPRRRGKSLRPRFSASTVPALLIDTHNDVTGFTVDGFDIGNSGPKHHTDLSRLKTGVLALCSLLPRRWDWSMPERKTAAVRALNMIDTIRTDIVGRYPERLRSGTKCR